MLKSLVDRPLPKLALTTVDGKPFDASTLRGKVVLLDFFASWCGICRAELPQLKTAYAKYQNDPKVAFLLVSIDEDDKRLQRYLTEMKFPFPVARLDAEQAEKTMGFDNVPQTFYVDAGGVVRYQLNGSESHGDSVGRVAGTSIRSSSSRDSGSRGTRRAVRDLADLVKERRGPRSRVRRKVHRRKQSQDLTLAERSQLTGDELAPGLRDGGVRKRARRCMETAAC